jgi:hypothetical protein
MLHPENDRVTSGFAVNSSRFNPFHATVIHLFLYFSFRSSFRFFAEGFIYLYTVDIVRFGLFR